MLVCTLLGPESDGSHFEQARVAFQDGAGAAYGAELVSGKGQQHLDRDGREMEGEKNMSEHVEQVHGKV